MITVTQVSKKYGMKYALTDVTFTIGQGEIIGLFGENGAGKTTLLKSILGFHSYEGTILLDEEAITRKNIARLSFATCEHSFFPNLTPADHALFYKEHFPKFRKKRFEALMEFFELPMKRKIKHFSTGQQNQFEVIMALCQGADYILMDEPFAGNDVFNREDFYKVLLGILEPDETIMLSTHLIEEVKDFIGRAILLKKGRIAADVSMTELEEKQISLMDYVKQAYGYQANRVSKALSELTEED